MYLRFFPTFKTRYIPIPQSSLSLREPTRRDEQQWIELRQKSQDFLKKWEPAWPKDDLTRAGFHRRLRNYTRQRQSGDAQTYFLFDDAKNLLLGGLSLTRIRKQPTASAVLGYWMGKEDAGNGYMSDGVRAALEHAFNRMNLDEVNAACLPRNKRSIALLEKSGFVRNGYSPKHLEINGVKEDHILFICSRELTVVHNRNPLENAGKSDIPMV